MELNEILGALSLVLALIMAYISVTHASSTETFILAFLGVIAFLGLGFYLLQKK